MVFTKGRHNKRDETKKHKHNLHRKDNLDKAAMIGYVLYFLAFDLLLFFSGLEIKSIVNVVSVFSGISIIPFLYAILAMIMFVLGLSFLSSYGFYRDCYRTAIPSILPAIVLVFLFGFSIISMMIAVAMIIASIYVIPLANTYGIELKRWKHFRTGSNSVSKVLIIFNIIIAFAVMLSVASNPIEYQDDFKNSLRNVVVAGIQVPEAFKPIVAAQIDKSISDIPLFQVYIKWLPAIAAFSFWVGLEFLRSLILSNVAGMFSFILIKVMSSHDKGKKHNIQYKRGHGKGKKHNIQYKRGHGKRR